MDVHQFYTRRAIGILVLLVLLGLAAVFYLFNNFIYQEKQSNGIVAEPYRASLSGEYVCLPDNELASRQTDECVFGLKTDTGEYYGIDFFLMSQTHDPVEVGQRISANGSVVPVERLNAAQWRRYPIEGIFSVTDSLTILDKNTLGRVTILLGDVGTVADVAISPKEVVSDSRCPIAVECVWAGTVEVRTVLSTQVAHGEHVLTLDEPQIFGDYTVTLVGVTPVKTEESILSSDYQFVYSVADNEL